jgi:hypothetical protein
MYLAYGIHAGKSKIEGPYLVKVLLLHHPMVEGRVHVQEERGRRGRELNSAFYQEPSPVMMILTHLPL